MRISSSVLPNAPWEESALQADLMAFDTRVNDRRLVVGIVVCEMDTPTLEERQLNPTSLGILGRIFMRRSFNYPGSPSGKNVVGMVESVEHAVQEVKELLRNTPDHSGLMLLCKNRRVYEAAFPSCVSIFS